MDMTHLIIVQIINQINIEEFIAGFAFMLIHEQNNLVELRPVQ